MEGLAAYVGNVGGGGAPTTGGRWARRAVRIGLAALLTAAALVAIDVGRGGGPSPARVVLPGSSAACEFSWTKTLDGTTLTVCLSKEGNVNQVTFPDATHSHVAFDGYCLVDQTDHVTYSDYSPGSGLPSTGFGPATLTLGPVADNYNPIGMTRTTSDGKFRLSEYIKINFQPRSIFVGMTVKNLDSVTHNIYAVRAVAPKLDNDATDDHYNEYGIGDTTFGRTGQAAQDPGPHTNSMVMGATQSDGIVVTEPVSVFQAIDPCSFSNDPPGPVTGGDHVLLAQRNVFFDIAPGAEVNVGKFVYRML